MNRYTSLRKFNKHLLRELGPVDEETKDCALYDAQEHLGLLVSDIIRRNKNIGKRKAFHKAVISFGTPSEIAEAYRMTQ